MKLSKDQTAELQKRKKQLEKEIQKSIQSFYKDTGLCRVEFSVKTNVEEFESVDYHTC